MTKRLFLLGSNIAYSLSPAMHNAALQTMGLDWHYALWDLPTEAVPAAVASLRADDCVGANVTIPHKATIIAGLDELGASARDVYAVNTIVKRDGRLIGENTDIYGFLRALQDVPFDPHGAHVVILGAGGAARGVAYALGQAGAASITLVNRTRSRAESFAQELRRHFPRLVTAANPADAPAKADLVVNSLPKTAAFDLVSQRVSPEVVAFDLTYRPAETPFMQTAKAIGMRAVNGLGMLVYQGVASLEMWSEQSVPVDVMFEAVNKRLARET
jgi:shikimate dehydrogenase